MANIKKAIFLKTKNIGDSIILTSAISALPIEYEHIDIVCLPESEPIFRMSPRVTNVYVIPRGYNSVEKWTAYFKILKQIFGVKYDFLAQFSIDWRGAILSRYLNVGVSVAKKNTTRNFIWHNSFNLIANVASTNRHTAEQDVDLLRKAQLYNKPEAPPYQLEVSLNYFNEIKAWLKNNQVSFRKKLIIIHASSRWKFKEIQVHTWAQIIDELSRKNYQIVISGSEPDYDTNKAIYDLCKSRPIICHNFTLFQTAALLKIADLLICVDTMSSHLASALNTKVLAIFGPTNEKNWGPWKTQNTVISLSMLDSPSFACRPCGKDGCGGSKTSYCLTAINPLNVVSQALELLKSS